MPTRPRQPPASTAERQPMARMAARAATMRWFPSATTRRSRAASMPCRWCRFSDRRRAPARSTTRWCRFLAIRASPARSAIRRSPYSAAHTWTAPWATRWSRCSATSNSDPHAVVHGDVVAVGGDLVRDPAAVVEGSVQNVSIFGHIGELAMVAQLGAQMPDVRAPAGLRARTGLGLDHGLQFPGAVPADGAVVPGRNQPLRENDGGATRAHHTRRAVHFHRQADRVPGAGDHGYRDDPGSVPGLRADGGGSVR